MNTTETHDLLQAFVRDRSEAAFEELVRRYIDLVYSAALRRVGGATLLAQDVTQLVFTDLARKAPSLPPRVMLGGWLHRHTGFVAATLMRSEQRRRERELEAVAMNALDQPSDDDWKQIAPVLDEALDGLPEADRGAVVLRFFEQRDFRSVGAALGTTEDAAQKRVTRALEKLRAFLTGRGVTLSIAGLGVVLGSRAVSAAPAGLAVRVSKTALAVMGAAMGSGVLAVLARLLGSTAAKFASGAALLGVIVGLWLANKHSQAAPNPIAAVLAARSAATSTIEPSAAQSNIGANLASAPAPAPSSNALHLVIVAGDSGKPVPAVQIDYRAWEGEQFNGRTLFANRFGVCDVEILRTTVTQLELTTRSDGFADTRLRWQKGRGDEIPAAYTVRLVRPTPIGGLVVDPDGHPLAGAKVGFNHTDDPATAGWPEDHHFGWIQVAADTNGQWAIDRIAPEMIRSIYGSASHPDFVQAPLVFASENRNIEQALRAGTYRFQLGRAVVVRGVVLDGDNAPVSGAQILVGHRGSSDSRKGESSGDGSFVIAGCRPGKTPVSAEADGFSAVTIETEATAKSEPIRLVLARGRALILRVVDASGQPVPKAHVWLNTHRAVPINDPDYGKLTVQADFKGTPDDQGRIVWSNAPEQELVFDIAASGHMRVNSFKVVADGREHLITLPPALVVSGTVRDAATGELIPKFRVVTGWPVTNALDRILRNFTNAATAQRVSPSQVRIVGGPFDSPVDSDSVSAHWSSFARDWLNFTKGTFSHRFETPMVYGMPNPGYMLKFEAEGYAPFTSRPIRPDEGEVRLDVTLRAAEALTVTVLLPDGRPAAHADVGLVMPQAGLELAPGGFSHRNVLNGESLRITDAAGTFQLPSDDNIRRIIVAHTAGFAEVTPAALASDARILLQPWGRLEGTYLVGGQPAAHRDLLFQYGGGDIASVHSSFENYRTTTDGAGHFVFEQVPTGNHKLMRLAPVAPETQQLAAPAAGGTVISPAARTSVIHLPLTDVEIRPGETTTITVGGGYVVNARLHWADGQKPGDARRIFAHIQTGYPAGVAEKMKAAVENPAALADLRQLPEVRDFLQHSHHYEATVSADAKTVSAENIPPGDYILVVGAIPEGNSGPVRRSVIAAETPFAVPADPASGSLDLGDIPLRPQ